MGDIAVNVASPFRALSAAPGSAKPIPQKQQQEIKSAVHHELIRRVDLDKLGTLQDSRSGQTPLLTLIQQLIGEQGIPLSSAERDRLAQEVLDEVFGLGPLEPLLKDSTISDILVNGHHQVYVERKGQLEKTATVFKDDRHLMHVIEKIVSAVGRRVDESSPMVDARLSDGSRVNVIIPPLAIDGPTVSIRRFATNPLGPDDLIRNRALTPPMLDFLKSAVKARMNVVISGGTGSGKTTLLSVLSGFISEKERIVTIEDSAELKMKQDHVVRLECRPPNVEGKGAVRQRELVINALRMRPDRVVLGEIRGGEALDMLQAMNTGHDGSMTTIHSNTPRDALARLQTMALMSDVGLPDKAIRMQIASAVHIIVQVARLGDGSRRVTHISELTGSFTDVISMQDIFLFEKQGLTTEGKIKGRFYATGIVPKCNDIFKSVGLSFPTNLLEHSLEV